MTGRHDSTPYTARCLHHDSAPPRRVTVRGMFSRGPAPAPSGGRAKPRRMPLSRSPAPEPLGRRTLDIRASIMLATHYKKLFENVNRLFQFFSPAGSGASGRRRRNRREAAEKQRVYRLFQPAFAHFTQLSSATLQQIRTNRRFSENRLTRAAEMLE